MSYMKMILQWIVAVVAAIVFVGCGEQHRDVPPQQDSGSVVIELLAEAVASPLTKAVEGAGWRNGDRVLLSNVMTGVPYHRKQPLIIGALHALALSMPRMTKLQDSVTMLYIPQMQQQWIIG
jgi:hypothetical protein